MKTKTFQAPIELKADSQKGEFTAVFSTFNVIDHDGDVTLPGAFYEGDRVRISYWGHRWHDLPVGRGVIHQDDTKAWVDGQFFLDTEAGRETYLTVKNLSDLQEWSYGFDIEESDHGPYEGEDVRFLRRLRVHEVSPVMLGAGIGTGTIDIKGRDDLLGVKFQGSPRNPYGTHASRGYPGGRAGWRNAWRVYLSRIDQGPIQGTVRRIGMIGATMKCDLPELSSEDIQPRSGSCGRLDGKIYETPSDYGLDSWKDPSDDDLTQEDVQLTCQDLEDLKRACLAEIAKRHACEDKARELKPFPNEHACRLRNPGDFEEDSFRRVIREHEGKQFSVIMGRLEGEDTMTEQAYRYPKDVWDADDARDHCKTHGGAFVPATEKGDGEGEGDEDIAKPSVVSPDVIRKHFDLLSEE